MMASSSACSAASASKSASARRRRHRPRRAASWRRQHPAQCRLDLLAHGLLGIKLRLLRQEADLDARHRVGLALEVLVEAGHDLQHRGLAGTIETQHADLGAREEGQRNVLDDFALRGHDLADPVHGVDELHGDARSGEK
jgi:hypothetical protein